MLGELGDDLLDLIWVHLGEAGQGLLSGDLFDPTSRDIRVPWNAEVRGPVGKERFTLARGIGPQDLGQARNDVGHVLRHPLRRSSSAVRMSILA